MARRAPPAAARARGPGRITDRGSRRGSSSRRTSLPGRGSDRRAAHRPRAARGRCAASRSASAPGFATRLAARPAATDASPVACESRLRTWSQSGPVPSPRTAPGGPVDQHEVRRARHVVVGPRLTRHHQRHLGGRELGDDRQALLRRILGRPPTSRTSAGRPSLSGSANASQNRRQVRHPLERNARSVSWSTPATRTVTASSSSPAPARSWPPVNPSRSGGDGTWGMTRNSLPAAAHPSRRRRAVRRLDARAELVQAAQDLGVAAQQPDDQQGQHDDHRAFDRDENGHRPDDEPAPLGRCVGHRRLQLGHHRRAGRTTATAARRTARRTARRPAAGDAARLPMPGVGQATARRRDHGDAAVDHDMHAAWPAIRRAPKQPHDRAGSRGARAAGP